jgi:hypothetical protein
VVKNCAVEAVEHPCNFEDLELLHLNACAFDGSTANSPDKVTLFERSGSKGCYLSYKRIKSSLHSRVGANDVRKIIIF